MENYKAIRIVLILFTKLTLHKPFKYCEYWYDTSVHTLNSATHQIESIRAGILCEETSQEETNPRVVAAGDSSLVRRVICPKRIAIELGLWLVSNFRKLHNSVLDK